MLKKLNSGLQIISSAIRIFINHKILIVPLLISWTIISSGVIYLKWYLPWRSLSFELQLLIVYIFYFFASCLILFSCSILVEMIEQDEHGKKMSFSQALSDTFTKNAGKLITLSILWSIVWFFLALLKALLSKNKDSETEKMSPENIARTLAEAEPLSWSTFTLNVNMKALRMIMFLIIPSFAWENKSFSASLKRGFSIIGDRASNFASGFLISSILEFILYLPVGLMFYLSLRNMVNFSNVWWYICIAYIGFSWSFTRYVEQLFGAELYLWQMKYESECAKAIENKKPMPDFEDIEKPPLLNEIHDFKHLKTMVN